MRSFQADRIVLPALRLVLAIAASIEEARGLLERRLPGGWCCEIMETPEGAEGLLVMPADTEAAPSFVVSAEGGEILLHALRDDRLEELGRQPHGAPITRLPRLGPLPRAA